MRNWSRAAGSAALLCSITASRGVEIEQPPCIVETVHKTVTHDGRAFAVRKQLLRQEARHRVYAYQYPSPVETGDARNDTVHAEYYEPANMTATDPPRPAVICMHILNGDFELVRLVCTVLAESGVPAIMFKLPYYGERGSPEQRRRLLHDPAQFAKCLEQAVSDVRRTVDLMACRREINGDRIGITGISLGAIVAAAACGNEPRLNRALLLLGGGDLETIMTHAAEMRRMREFLSGLAPNVRDDTMAVLRSIDPLTHGAALRRLGLRGRLRMINAAEDEVIPRACSEKLARAAGIDGQVTWLEGMGHYTAMAAIPRVLRDTSRFFAEDLPPGVLPPPRGASSDLSPLHTFAAVCKNMVAVLNAPSATNRCHLARLTAEITTGSRKQPAYHVSLVRGAGERFRLEGHPVPEVGTAIMGNGAYPWFAARDGTVYAGRIDANPERCINDYITASARARVQVLNGVATALAMAPEAFTEYLDIERTQGPDGRAGLLNITFKQRGSIKGTGTLRYRLDALTPLELTFDGGDTKGTVRFEHWDLDTVSSPELFVAPRGAKVREVPADDVQRMFAAAFAFAMESAR